jgi:enamine deaminase RidA (YjgF/YER057c/UK114 family)
MRNVFSIAVVLLAGLSPFTAAAEPIEYFNPPGWKKAGSAAVRVGDKIYLSGATGAATDGSIPTDFTAQATNAMNEVASRLRLAGASMDDVYKCTVALIDMKDWQAFNDVYLKYFKPDRLPVRMALGLTSVGGSAVEVQCEASVST